MILNLAQEWDRLNLLRDQIVRVALGPRVITGKVQGIDEQGALVFMTASKYTTCSEGKFCVNPPAAAA